MNLNDLNFTNPPDRFHAFGSFVAAELRVKAEMQIAFGTLCCVKVFSSNSIKLGHSLECRC